MVISPTVRGRVLAKMLRDLRTESGHTQNDVAKGIGWKQSKISRIEARDQYVSVSDAYALSSFYDVSPGTRDRLLALTRDARKTGWWVSYLDLIPEWFDTFVGMEAESSSLFTYEPEFIPGLLQTEDYARATTRATLLDATTEDVERTVQLRMERQKRLSQPENLQVWAVIGEAALLRPIGGEAVLRAQLAHLADLSAEPGITVQVMPFRAGGHPAISPFVYLAYPEKWLPEVVYLETQAGAQWIEDATQVRKFGAVAEHLRTHALDPEGSVHALRKRAGGPGARIQELAEGNPKRRFR